MDLNKLSILDAALAYLDRHWCVVPVKRGQKAPAVRWKQYQDIRPDEKRIHQWFSNERYNALAVLLGPVSNHLACRDFDKADSYEGWSARNANFASHLPTVQTGRGYHVYFRNENCALTVLADGELRGSGGVCLLPPSVHPTGKRYEWIIPLGNEVPLIDPVQYKLIPPEGVTDETDDTEDTDETKAVVLGGVIHHEQLRNCSSILARHRESISQALHETLPNGPGQRERLIFEFARALKAIPELTSLSAEAFKASVVEWHRQALPHIITKPFEATWSDFLYGWDNVKVPRGVPYIDFVLEQAMKCPMNVPYELAELKTLILFCRTLQETVGNRPFYLSARTAAEICNIDPMTALRRLHFLEREGWIRTVEKGNQHRATRFRYIGCNEK